MIVNDTSKNPKLIVSELAIFKLKNAFNSKLGVRPKLSKADINERLKNLSSNIQTAKWSYVDKSTLINSEEVIKIIGIAKEIKEAIKIDPTAKKPNYFQIRTIEWACDIFMGLARRLENDNPDIVTGIDYFVIGIRHITKSEKLYVAKCYQGERDISVVTNIPGLKPGLQLGIAYLPPVAFGDIVSEAMFLGHEPRSEKIGTLLNPDQLILKETSAILRNELKKVH